MMAGIIWITLLAGEEPQEVSIAQVFHLPIHLFQKYVLVATVCGYPLGMKTVPPGLPHLIDTRESARAGFLEPHPHTPTSTQENS